MVVLREGITVRSWIRRAAVAALAAVAASSISPSVVAAELDLGSTIIEVPDLHPVFVPVPLGSEAAPLPPLPYPAEWVYPPAPAPAPAPAVDPFGGRTAVLNCGHEPERRPNQIIILCGDGTGQFQNIRWTSWLDNTAEATADKVWVECIPACYNGIRRSKPARIVLHDVRHTNAGPTFSRITSHDDLGARTTTLPGFMHAGDHLFP